MLEFTASDCTQVAEELLYHWKSFPIVLPPSVTAAGVEENGENSKVVPLS